MLDFLKLNNLSIGLEVKDLLSFPIHLDPNTGEILLRKQSTKICNLICTITPGIIQRVKLQGSIHKYANLGYHNYDRFCLSRFLEASDQLKEIISPEDRINILEFGVNLNTSFAPSDFIKGLIAHKKKRINITDRQGELSSEVKYSQYTLKIYDKGLKFKKDNILRIELRVSKMESIYPNGLKWRDLKDPKTWQYLGERLVKSVNELIYYDSKIDFSAIPSKKERELLKLGNNTIYWEQISVTHPRKKKKTIPGTYKKTWFYFRRYYRIN